MVWIVADRNTMGKAVDEPRGHPNEKTTQQAISPANSLDNAVIEIEALST
jgi:hypothetical protein